MGHIYPNFPKKVKEVSGNCQATTYQSTVPKTVALSTIKNQTDVLHSGT